MIEAKTCPKCGANLKYDATNKQIVCPFCGAVEQKIATLEEVDEAIGNSAFSMAKKQISTLKEEKPDDPRLTLREIRCEIGCQNIASHLLKNRKNPEVMKKISELSKWDDLSAQLSDENGEFISDVKKYCKIATGIREAYQMLGNSRSAGRPAEYSRYLRPPAPSAKPKESSVSSQMGPEVKAVEDAEAPVTPIGQEDSGKIVAEFEALTRSVSREASKRKTEEKESALLTEKLVGGSIVFVLVCTIFFALIKGSGGAGAVLFLLIALVMCGAFMGPVTSSFSNEETKVVKYAGTTAMSETTIRKFEETIQKGEAVLDALYPKIAEAEKRIES